MEQLLVKLRQEQRIIQEAFFERAPTDFSYVMKQWAIHHGLEQAIMMIEKEIISYEEAEKRN